MLKYYHIPVKNSKPSDRSKFDKARWSYPSVSLWRKQKLRLTKEISSKTNAVVWAKSPLQDDLTTLSFDIILTRFNKMKEYVRIYLMQNHSTCFGCPSHLPPGVYKTVTAASGKGHSIWAKTFLQLGQIGHVCGRLLLRYTDLYRKLQLQFYVLLMMGAMDTRKPVEWFCSK